MADIPDSVLAAIGARTGRPWDVLAGRHPGPPIKQLLGFSALAVAPEGGSLTLRFPGKPEFANPAGVIQGGMLAAMLDSLLGITLATTFQPGETLVTLELKVSFIRPAPIAPLVGTGRVVRRGRAVGFLEGELRDEAGELIATATATALIQAPRAGS